jgi:hypothetical protein
VALSERIDPANAPYPSNESERLLFRQLYESLVRVDCDGRVAPALAQSWRFDAAKGAWIVTLRELAQYADGHLVTANSVISNWTVRNPDPALRPEVRKHVRSVVALDLGTLEIVLENPNEDAPRALAHTDLAIVEEPDFVTQRGPVWPLGTRLRFRTEAVPAPAAGSSVITTRPLLEDLPSRQFRIAPGRDARDLLDGGADLIVTRDPTALDYAATLPGFVSVPLPWQRTYALVAPGRNRTARSLSLEERDLLAHDAVRGEAQGSKEPFWWQSPSGCDILKPMVSIPRLTPRIVYDANDSVARDLAERLVGLGRASSPGATAMLEALAPDRSNRSFQRAVGLSGAALAMARKTGSDAAYILALERRPLEPCGETKTLMEAMGWLDPETIVPLVDTRMRAIVRRGRSGLTAEWDGGLLIVDR